MHDSYKCQLQTLSDSNIKKDVEDSVMNTSLFSTKYIVCDRNILKIKAREDCPLLKNFLTSFKSVFN